MSSKSEPDPPAPKKGTEWPLPSWKKIGEFVTGVLQLERNVSSLQEKNKKLEAEVAALQRQADDHAGQLRVVMNLIESTINERAAKTAEQAAARVIERFLSLRDDRSPKGR